MVRPGTNTIDASVTKSFFVEMLVKDVTLQNAILDLIDNCIDGARRLKRSERFDGLEVDIRLSTEEFAIKDNCGGIDLETAMHYAFRFGRPSDAPGVPRGIGRFGVGMKRAVFKLGRRFNVASTAASSRFEVDVNVPRWERQRDWNFDLRSVEEFESAVGDDETGTTVRVTELFDSVKVQFGQVHFLNLLRSAISSKHQEHLDNGLAILVNGSSIAAAPVRFLVFGDELVPAFRQEQYNGVAVRLITGFGDSTPSEAGWYLFCNGRMVLRSDQSEVTGWGDPGITRIPKYHNQFARFRGCAYLDSEDATVLPWNTTKDGVDEESRLYHAIRSEMVATMRPVITGLNDLDAEQDQPEGFRPLTDLLGRATLTRVSALPKREVFAFKPREPRPPGPRMIRIQYDREFDTVNKVKRSLGVASAKAAGEETFDYYLSMELEE